MYKCWMLLLQSAFLLITFPRAHAADDKGVSKPANKIVELTPEQASLHLLEGAMAQLAASPAILRVHTCYQAALGYSRISNTKETAVLMQCFTQSLGIEDKDLAAKTSLQLRIMDALYFLDANAAQELLPMAEVKAKANIQARILQKVVNEKRYDEALAQITRDSYAADFPYKAAVTLMQNFPKDRSQDFRLVFTAALQSYRLEDPAIDPKLEDMATLIVRFWRDLPPQLVMAAIEEVLDHAKKDLKNTSAPSITIGTGLGEAQFSTAYQYRLFELTPIIRELDAAKAESIERENPALSNVIRDYPQGLQSLEPTYRGTTLRAGESPKFTITYRLRPMNGTAEAGSKDLQLNALSRQSAEILQKTANDPRAALSKAMELPDIGIEETLRSVRADALARMATNAPSPDVASQAITSLVDVAEKYPPLSKAMYLLIASRIYLGIKDKAAATALIQKAADVAGKLYALDDNHDAPNHAFKFDWPSAVVWRACVVLQNRIDTDAATALLGTIKDPEIRANVQVVLAGERLGVALPANIVRQQFGDGPGSVQDFPIIH